MNLDKKLNKETLGLIVIILYEELLVLMKPSFLPFVTNNSLFLIRSNMD